MGLRDWLRTTPITETVLQEAKQTVARSGYEAGMPIGGTPSREMARGSSGQRRNLMDELHQVYLACAWVSASVDAIARLVTAGGLAIASTTENDAVMGADIKAINDLLRYTNEREDMVQLVRSTVVDLLLFGDAFIEVGYLGDTPVALWTLDSTTTSIRADEHGQINGFIQTVAGGRVAEFQRDEVIHISLDSARGGLYGTSPTQKLLVPITAWLFTSATLKEFMRRGAPTDIAVDLGQGTSDQDYNKWLAQYQQQRLGPRAQGQPIITRVTRGTEPPVKELAQRRIDTLMTALDQLRDTIISGYGLSPANVGVIESGNLGGGSGESQALTTHYSTVVPLQQLIAEKITYQLLTARGIDGWAITFGQVDYRDSKTVEDIRDMRLKAGAITINEWRAEIGQPPIVGGDVAVIVDRHGAVPWERLGEVVSADTGAQAVTPQESTLTESWAKRYASQRRAIMAHLPKQ